MNDSTEQDILQIDEQIAELVACIREHREAAERHEQEITKAKERLALLLEQRGSNWSDQLGYARLTSEGMRLDYDTSALDALIIEDPLRYGWLKDYRTKSPIPARVMVR